jgi:hypothetical protein
MAVDADTRQPARPATRRRERLEEGRRLGTAGHALVIAATALVLGTLLNAQGIYKTAYNQPEGWEREVALAVAGPLRDVSHALWLDRPRQWLKDAIGRENDDEIDTAIALPTAAQPPPAAVPATPPPAAQPPPAAPPPAAAPPPPAAPAKVAFTPKRKLRLWVAGDSLVVTPGWAIVRAAGGTPVIESVGGVDGRVATGLERPDVFNWFTHIREQLKTLKPKVIVLSFGGNDDHGYMTGLPEGVTLDGFAGPVWTREYRRRVGGLMDTASRVGTYVVWIGLPITSSQEQSARFDVINRAVAAEAKERPDEVAFVDTYTMFASDTGGYAEYLEDTAGRLQKVRAGDGVHFERAGGDIIAREVLRRLNQAFDLTSWRKRASSGTP